jgi:hypothetical protein
LTLGFKKPGQLTEIAVSSLLICALRFDFGALNAFTRPAIPINPLALTECAPIVNSLLHYSRPKLVNFFLSRIDPLFFRHQLTPHQK